MATRGMSSGILDFGGACPCWMAVLTSAIKSSIVSRNSNLASSAKVKCRCSTVSLMLAKYSSKLSTASVES